MYEMKPGPRRPSEILPWQDCHRMSHAVRVRLRASGIGNKTNIKNVMELTRPSTCVHIDVAEIYI